MSVERTRDALMTYLDLLIRRGAYPKCFADDVTIALMGSGQEIKGRDAVEQFIRGFHEQAFDATPHVKKMAFGDDYAAIEVFFVGTHIGEFGGVPASGNQVNVPYVGTYDFRGDKITAIRLYFPMDALMQQISAVPALVEAGA